MNQIPAGPAKDELVCLSLDASTDACSVALESGGRVWSRFQVTPRGHARELLGMLDAVLAESGLARDRITLLAYGRGPGAFTGVRISVGVAQGLAWGLGVPVVGVSTLAAVAQGAIRRHAAQAGAATGPQTPPAHGATNGLHGARVLAALDARMGEVYWGAYALDAASGLMLAVGDEAVGPPAQVRVPAPWVSPEQASGKTPGVIPCLGAGSGWDAHGQALGDATGIPFAGMQPDAMPDARDMLAHARFAWERGLCIPADQAAPVYLRNHVTG